MATNASTSIVNDEVIDFHRFRHLLSSIRHCSLQQVRAFFESESFSVPHAKRLVNVSFPGEDTALTCACRRDNLEIVRYLLHLGADPNLPNSVSYFFEAKSTRTYVFTRFHRLMIYLFSSPVIKDTIPSQKSC